MDSISSRSQFPGTAKGFLAARRRRRERLAVPPQLRWERIADVVATAGEAPLPAFRLRNEGGEAAEVCVVLFRGDTIGREQTGGAIDFGERWDFSLGRTEASTGESVRGYALGRGSDGRWFATTVDGRTASFRTMPDELGVCRTLGLRMPAVVEPQEGSIRWEPVPDDAEL